MSAVVMTVGAGGRERGGWEARRIDAIVIAQILRREPLGRSGSRDAAGDRGTSGALLTRMSGVTSGTGRRTPPVLVSYVQRTYIRGRTTDRRGSSERGRNLRQHGVSFEEAETVFSDDFAILMPDPDHSGQEDRFLLLGCSAGFRILVVVHCYREPNVIRIISARKATPSERAQYGTRWKR